MTKKSGIELFEESDIYVSGCKLSKKKAQDTPSPEEAKMYHIKRIVKLNQSK